MHIKPIKTDEDYALALAQLAELIEQDPSPESAAADHLEVLGTLVQVYEAEHHALPSPDPIEAIKFRMEQGQLNVRDLEPMIGKSNRVYEVLSRQRPLTLRMIRNLHQGLGISAAVLIAA